MKRRLVILTAVALEARAVAGVWGLTRPLPRRPVRTDRFVPSVEVHVVGIGGVGLPLDLSDPPVSGIIMAGLAGAIDPSLRVGDVVIDDCPPEYLPDIDYRRGRIVNSSRIVGTPEEKRELFERTGALAVDMESDAARDLATSLGVPFASIRAISDGADESLDPKFLRLIDSYGRIRLFSLMAHLAMRPQMISQLRRLERSTQIASRRLALALAQVVRKWTDVGVKTPL